MPQKLSRIYRICACLLLAVGELLLLICLLACWVPDDLKPSDADCCSDLLLNLGTEFVGIGIGSLVLQGFVGWLEEELREERLSPDMRLLCINLLRIADDFLHDVLPDGLCRPNSVVYKYKCGESYITPRIEFVEIEEKVLSDLAARLGRRVELGKLDGEILVQARGKLDDICDRSSHLFNRRLKEHMDRLNVNLADALALLDDVASVRVVGWARTPSREGFVTSLGETITAMLGVKKWVHSILDDHYDPDDRWLNRHKDAAEMRGAARDR